MTDDIATPDSRLAAAGDAHNAAIRRLLDELRAKSDAARDALVAKAEAERAKAGAVEDKERIASYLESVTESLNAEIDALNPMPDAPIGLNDI